MQAWLPVPHSNFASEPRQISKRFTYVVNTFAGCLCWEYIGKMCMLHLTGRCLCYQGGG